MEKNEVFGPQRGDAVPERLRQRTIETMQPDAPYVVASDGFIGLEGTVWVDTSDPEKWTLAIGKEENVKTLAPEHHENDDLLVVMRAYTVNESGELVEGLVADVRDCSAQFDEYDTQKAVEETDDTEALWGTMKVNRDKVRILAIVDKDEETGGLRYYGDPAFYEAAKYLAQQVDDMFAENFQDITKRAGSKSSKTPKKKIRK